MFMSFSVGAQVDPTMLLNLCVIADRSSLKLASRKESWWVLACPFSVPNFNSTSLQIDCSHGNSSKQHRKQIEVAEDIVSKLCAPLVSHSYTPTGAATGIRGHVHDDYGSHDRV